MADEAVNKQGGEGTAGAGAAGVPQGGQGGVAGAAAGQASGAGVAGAGQPKAAPSTVDAGGGGTKEVTLTDDGEIPSDAAFLRMPRDVFNKRLKRAVSGATKKELKERFGTDDLEQIKKDQDELRTLREEKETRRKSELSELDKAKEAAAQAEARATAAERKTRQQAEQHEYERDNRRVERVAEAFIDSEFVEPEMERFAKHLVDNFTEKELTKMTPEKFKAEAKGFFEKRIQERPKLAKDYEDRQREILAKEIKANGGEIPKKKPLTNGARTDGRAATAAAPTSEGKTFAPGKPNSMTDAEAKAKMRAMNGGRSIY